MRTGCPERQGFGNGDAQNAGMPKPPWHRVSNPVSFWFVMFRQLWGSPILFPWRVNGHFCFAWNVNEDLFFPWFVNLYFSALGKLVFHFFVIREICINLRVICEPTTFAGIDFHFFGDFSAIKASKLHQTTRCKTCLFDVLADGGLRSNHSDSKPTETFQYTHFNSCHPPGIKNDSIKGEAMRLLRTNSSKTTFEESLVKFKQRLRTHGYPKTIIERSLSGVNFAARPSALTKKKMGSERILPFVTT